MTTVPIDEQLSAGPTGLLQVEGTKPVIGSAQRCPLDKKMFSGRDWDKHPLEWLRSFCVHVRPASSVGVHRFIGPLPKRFYEAVIWPTPSWFRSQLDADGRAKAQHMDWWLLDRSGWASCDYPRTKRDPKQDDRWTPKHPPIFGDERDELPSWWKPENGKLWEWDVPSDWPAAARVLYPFCYRSLMHLPNVANRPKFNKVSRSQILYKEGGIVLVGADPDRRRYVRERIPVWGCNPDDLRAVDLAGDDLRAILKNVDSKNCTDIYAGLDRLDRALKALSPGAKSADAAGEVLKDCYKPFVLQWAQVDSIKVDDNRWRWQLVDKPSKHIDSFDDKHRV